MKETIAQRQPHDFQYIPAEFTAAHVLSLQQQIPDFLELHLVNAASFFSGTFVCTLQVLEYIQALQFVAPLCSPAGLPDLLFVILQAQRSAWDVQLSPSFRSFLQSKISFVVNYYSSQLQGGSFAENCRQEQPNLKFLRPLQPELLEALLRLLDTFYQSDFDCLVKQLAEVLGILSFNVSPAKLKQFAPRTTMRSLLHLLGETQMEIEFAVFKGFLVAQQLVPLTANAFVQQLNLRQEALEEAVVQIDLCDCFQVHFLELLVEQIDFKVDSQVAEEIQERSQLTVIAQPTRERLTHICEMLLLNTNRTD